MEYDVPVHERLLASLVHVPLMLIVVIGYIVYASFQPLHHQSGISPILLLLVMWGLVLFFDVPYRAVFFHCVKRWGTIFVAQHAEQALSNTLRIFVLFVPMTVLCLLGVVFESNLLLYGGIGYGCLLSLLWLLQIGYAIKCAIGGRAVRYYPFTVVDI
jgi:hypothetical protein